MEWLAGAAVATQLLGGYFAAEAGRDRTDAQAGLYGEEAAAFRASAEEARRLARLQARYAMDSAREQAGAILEQGGQEAAYVGREGRRRVGSIRASAGSSGVQMRGTVLTVLTHQAAENDKAVRTVEWNAEQAARMVVAEGIRGANAALEQGRVDYDNLLRQAGLRDRAADAVTAGADEAWWATILGAGGAAAGTGYNWWRASQ